MPVLYAILAVVGWLLVGYFTVRFAHWFDRKVGNVGSDTVGNTYLLIFAGPLAPIILVLFFIVLFCVKIAEAIHKHVKAISSS